MGSIDVGWDDTISRMPPNIEISDICFATGVVDKATLEKYEATPTVERVSIYSIKEEPTFHIIRVATSAGYVPLIYSRNDMTKLLTRFEEPSSEKLIGKPAYLHGYAKSRFKKDAIGISPRI